MYRPVQVPWNLIPTSQQGKILESFLRRVLHLTVACGSLESYGNIIHMCPSSISEGWILRMLEDSWEGKSLCTLIQWNWLGTIKDCELGRWFSFLLFCFETGSCYIAHAGLELTYSPLISFLQVMGLWAYTTIPWWRRRFACVWNMYVYRLVCTWIYVQMWRLVTNIGYLPQSVFTLYFET